MRLATTHSTAGSGATLWTAIAVIISVSLLTSPAPSHVARAGEPETLVVPRARVAPVIDGIADDRAWTDAAATTGYLRRKDGSLAVPVAEASLVYTSDYLYLALIASDVDVRTGDRFHVVFDNGRGLVAFDVSPDGLTHGASGSRAIAETSGTKNDSRDVDHEWIAEVMVPFSAIGLRGRIGDRIGFSISHCDEPTGECAGFGEDGNAGPSGRLVLGD